MPLYTKYLPDNSRSEIELLIRCSQAFLGDKNIEFINNTARKDIDWNYLVQISLRHRVMPLLYRNLKNVCSNGVPEEITAQLRNYYLSNAARNILMTNELCRVLEVLEEDGVQALPFKGPVLSEFVYGNIACRQFDDLDVLIHGRDVVKARKMILDNGYRDEIGFSDETLVGFVGTNALLTFANPNKKSFLQIHWEMSGKYVSKNLDLHGFQNRLKKIEFSGKQVHTLLPEDLLLYLCIHGTKHRWDKLEMLFCIAQLLTRHAQIDWHRIIFLSETMNCERMLLLGLFMVRDLFNINLPEHILKKISNDAKMLKITSQIYKNLFQETAPSSEASKDIRKYLFNMNVRNRLSEKIRYILHMLFRPKIADWMTSPMPPSLYFLNYIFRPLRLLLKWTLWLLEESMHHCRCMFIPVPMFFMQVFLQRVHRLEK